MTFGPFAIRPGALGALALALGLAGCDDAPPPGGPGAPSLVQTHASAPPGAPAGTCWAKDITPAVIESVTERIPVPPAAAPAEGAAPAPPTYRVETRRAIVKARRELWFQTPCEDQLTPDFLSSLQRALAARGYFNGPVSGEIDTRTLRAIRRFQAPRGLDSGVLALSSARALGLVAVDRVPAD